MILIFLYWVKVWESYESNDEIWCNMSFKNYSNIYDFSLDLVLLAENRKVKKAEVCTVLLIFAFPLLGYLLVSHPTSGLCLLFLYKWDNLHYLLEDCAFNSLCCNIYIPQLSKAQEHLEYNARLTNIFVFSQLIRFEA